MKRVYHKWEMWECYKAGFYNNTQGLDRENKIKLVLGLFQSKTLTIEYMRKAIVLWPYSCNHFLSNINMNRIAYIGQAACCLYGAVPNLITMEAWSLLSIETQTQADNIAKSIIREWEQNKKYRNTLTNGSQEIMKKGFQMRLQLN